ncbi:ABC transporter ATP-binding protein [Planctomycetaceae bacterium SH139]
MPRPVISVENLSKAYRIGAKEEVPDTLMGSLSSVLRSPLKNFSNLKKLSAIREGNEDEDVLWALRDVSFEVKEGEVLGVIGRNGAGKSTLLKILSRITEPTSGRVVIHGRVSSLLEVGTGFHPELSGRDNIYMNGTILGMTKREIDRKFDEIVDFSGVEKFLDTPTKRYSSGMQVRLAFAVAAHLEPEILVIDEVLAVGDAEFQKRCLGKMKDVAQDGRTVLFVSHNMGAVESLCSRAIEIQHGKLVFNASVDEAIEHYHERIHQRTEMPAENPFSKMSYIKDASLLDRMGNTTTFLVVGGTFHLRIKLDSDRRLTGPKIGVGINSINGQRMLTIHTPAKDSPVDYVDGCSAIDCVIDKFPLCPGNYTLKVALTDNSHELESVEDVVPFSIVDGEIFREGRGFHRGVCIAESTWSRQESLRT